MSGHLGGRLFYRPPLVMSWYNMCVVAEVILSLPQSVHVVPGSTKCLIWLIERLFYLPIFNGPTLCTSINQQFQCVDARYSQLEVILSLGAAAANKTH